MFRDYFSGAGEFIVEWLKAFGEIVGIIALCAFVVGGLGVATLAMLDFIHRYLPVGATAAVGVLIILAFVSIPVAAERRHDR